LHEGSHLYVLERIDEGRPGLFTFRVECVLVVKERSDGTLCLIIKQLLSMLDQLVPLHGYVEHFVALEVFYLPLHLLDDLSLVNLVEAVLFH